MILVQLNLREEYQESNMTEVIKRGGAVTMIKSSEKSTDGDTVLESSLSRIGQSIRCHSKYNQKPCDQIYSSDDMLDEIA